MTYGGDKVGSGNEARMRIGIATVIVLLIFIYSFINLESIALWSALGMGILLWVWIVSANLTSSTIYSGRDLNHNLGVAYRGF